MYDSNQTFGSGMGPNVNQGYSRPYINPSQQQNYPYPMPNQQQSMMPNQNPNQPYLNQSPQQPYSYPGQHSYGNMSQAEESYVDNFLKLNKGKMCCIFCTYPHSQEWRDRTYKGVIENAGRDHLILSDPNTGYRYLLNFMYIDWIEFLEEVNCEYPLR